MHDWYLHAAYGLWWAAALLIAYTYLIYPAVLAVLTWRRSQPQYPTLHELPRLSLILAAYNEAATIREKIENTLALDYPVERLEFIVVSDGSTDETDRIVAEYAERGVQALRLPENRGKTAAQNAGVRQASGDILVFSDANSLYAADALRELIKPFADPQVGCVCGELHYTNPAHAPAGRGEGLYWRYERFLKRRESLLGSALGANGSIYALRRELFVELDAEIISDFIMPVRIWRSGYRVVYQPTAVAVESTGKTFQDEFHRRTRIIARSMYGLWRERAVLDPLRHGMFAVQMISHKVLRWLVPEFLLILLSASAVLAHSPFYRTALWLQLAFYGVAVLGHLFQNRLAGVGPLYLPAYFCAINLGALLGLWSFLRGRRFRVWRPVSRV